MLAVTGGNYTLNFTTGIPFEIKLATLTITPDAGQHKEYGEVDPVPLTYTATGWKYNDAMANLLTGALIRDAGENVGVV
jgi:hypothetical protein